MANQEINFTRRLINSSSPWYDGFKPHNLEKAQTSRKFGTKQRVHAVTVHRYQAFSNGTVCGLMYSLPGQETRFSSISSNEQAQLTFEISGGVEIPHFVLSLRLAYKLDPRAKDVSYLRLKMIWAAWDETGGDQNRPTLVSKHTFSARLGEVSFAEVTLSNDTAASCQGTSDNQSCLVQWTCTVVVCCPASRMTQCP